MIGTPEEIACDLFMASASTLITEAMENMSEENRRLLRNGVERGSLRVIADIPPLKFHILIVEPDGNDRHLTISDDRPKWRTWAQDLVRWMA